MDNPIPALQAASTDFTAGQASPELPGTGSQPNEQEGQQTEPAQQFKLFDPVESACKRHPGLTPEQALEWLEKFGY